MADLKGKVALVTGAAGMRGMGRAIALRLARDGADVVVTDQPHSPQAMTPEARASGWKGVDSVAEEIKAMGRQGLAIGAELTSASDVDAMVAHALEKFGKIDILVNNAGITGSRTQVVDQDLRDWSKVLRVNLTGTFLVTKPVAKSMIKQGQGGKIIMIASFSAKLGMNGLAAYSASKAAQVSLTQTLALELAQYKINVNAICPGRFGTDIGIPVLEQMAKAKGITLEELLKGMPKPDLSTIPLGRQGNVDEIASAVAFLASSESDYITGQAINVCGGFMTVR